MRHDPIHKKVMRLIADGCESVYALSAHELGLLCMELIAEINKQRLHIATLKDLLNESNGIIRKMSEDITIED